MRSRDQGGIEDDAQFIDAWLVAKPVNLRGFQLGANQYPVRLHFFLT